MRLHSGGFENNFAKFFGQAKNKKDDKCPSGCVMVPNLGCVCQGKNEKDGQCSTALGCMDLGVLGCFCPEENKDSPQCCCPPGCFCNDEKKKSDQIDQC